MSGRVWDPYLTERDRAHLAASRDERVGFGKKPALLLIDLYRAVFGDKPEPLLEAIKTWPMSCGLEAWESLGHTQILLGVAREVGIPVIHVAQLATDGLVNWREAAHSRAPVVPEEMEPIARDRWLRRYDIVDQVAPIEGEAELRKSSPSPFRDTPILGHLNYLGVDTLITVGESASGCVRASVVDGCAARFRMIVVEEGVFDRHEATHALNLFDLHQKYADVIPLETALEYLQDWKARQGQQAPTLEPVPVTR